ncbi:dTMP kinase [Candidatus Micrarchaeota archaeon]|nr:dTMP kinase [Candidatus Micrarchaeota archaeon]
MIIVFEGIDRTGKDTQVELVYKWLRNMWVTNCYIHRYPKEGDTKIRNYLRGDVDLTDEEVAVEYLKEMVNEKEIIEKESERGVVILNRYYFSTIAYQGQKIGFNELIADVQKLNLPKPDYVILLDGKPDELAKRDSNKDRHEKNLVMQVNARDNYHELASNKFFEEKEWVIIDAGKPVEEVAKDVQEAIQKMLSINANKGNSVV